MKYIFALILIIIVGGTAFVLSTISKNKSEPTSELFETQVSESGGVTVIVTPKTLSENSPVWTFEIVLNTHSVELDQDLTKTAILTDESGIEYMPLGFEGDPPGGHHREGILSFKPTKPLPQSITLILQGIGDVQERTFAWSL